jgi:uncharacterized lipoprotein YehR (DUF1307 family)
MNTAIRKRLAALETHKTVQAHDALDSAVKRILDTLEAAYPHIRGVTRPSPHYSHAVITEGCKTTYTQIHELGLRLRAGTETADDRHALATIPDDALAVMGVDARGVVEWLMELDEKV